MSTFERNQGISKIAWMNEVVMSPKTSADLTSTYANDVLQSMEDREFPTLRAAIDELASRVGLSKDMKEGIRQFASIKYNPRLLIAMENVQNLDASGIEQALVVYNTKCEKCSAAPCSCGSTMSETMKQAMEETGIDSLKKKLAFLKYEPATKVAMATEAEIVQIWKDAPMDAIIKLDAYTKGGGYIKDAEGKSTKTPPHVKIGEKLRKGVPGKMGGELKGTGYGKEGDDTPQNKINGYSMACAANAMSIVDDAEREQTLKRCFRSYLVANIIKIEYGGKIWDFRKDHGRNPEDGDNPAETLNHEPGEMTHIDAATDEPVPSTFKHPSAENRWKAPSSHKHYKDLTDEEMQALLNKENGESGDAAASAKAIYLQKIAGADFKKIKQIKEELGCSQGEAMKEYWKREKAGRDEKVENGEGNDKVTMRKDKKKDKSEDKEDKKKDKSEDKEDESEDKKDKKDKKDKEPKEDKKEKDMDAKASNKQKWGEFFKKKGWFQGNDEPTKEGDITANDPAKIGYPKDMEYARGPMAVPVGEDARPWEQKWFENAATETAKDMGPSGAELKEKKELQRASWKAFLSKKASEKK